MKASAAALAAILLALVAATAEAAPYTVRLCTDPQATGFVARNDNPAALTATATCPWSDEVPYSGVFAGVKPGTAGVARGVGAGWTLTAPAGTSFEEVTVRRRLRKADRDYEVVVAADGKVVDGCAANVRCDEEVTTRAYEVTRELAVSVRCADATCGNSPQGSRAWIAIESATAQINDPAPPTVSVTASGWQRAPTVTVSAADASGVASLALVSGARTLGTTTLRCDDRHLRPCPATGTATFAPDLPDGTHPITARATDAAKQTASATGTLKVDRTAPGPPENLTVRSHGDAYLYTWTNPDQGTAAPIVAAHRSDGTVVRGANLQQLESTSPVERIYLEDEAGNADPATAVGVPAVSAVSLNPPVLHQNAAAPKVKLTSAKRSGTRLVVRGTVSHPTAKRVTATVTRGKRTARKSATLSNGRFTIRIALNATMRRKGTVTLTVRHGTAKATKRLRF